MTVVQLTSGWLLFPLTLSISVKLGPTSGNIIDQISPNILVLQCFPKLWQRQLSLVAAFTSFIQHIQGLPLLLFFFPQPYPAWLISPDFRFLHALCPNDDRLCFSISASNVDGGLLSTSTDLFVLLVVQGIFNIYLQHHISTVNILLFFLSFFLFHWP